MTTLIPGEVRFHSKLDEALSVAREALAIAEQGEGTLVPVLTRVLRVGRLVGNEAVVQWMNLELRGYRTGVLRDDGMLPYASWSGREADIVNGQQQYWIASFEEIETELAIARSELAANVPPLRSLSSLGENVGYGQTPAERIISSANMQRLTTANALRRWTKVIATVRGTTIQWLSDLIIQLQYGMVMEGVFDRTRRRTDSYLATHAPAVSEALAAATRRSTSRDAEELSQALTSCRRALKALADAVFPATADIDGVKLGEDAYLNRLTEFVKQKLSSRSQGTVLEAELKSLYERAEALNQLASKGVHGNVDEQDLEMTLLRVYLLAGEILALLSDEEPQPLLPDEGALPDPEAMAEA